MCFSPRRRQSPRQQSETCSISVDQFGCRHQADPLRLRVRQNFAESLERRGVRMTDGHSFALFMGASQCQFELFVDRGYLATVAAVVRLST